MVPFMGRGLPFPARGRERNYGDTIFAALRAPLRSHSLALVRPYAPQKVGSPAYLFCTPPPSLRSRSALSSEVQGKEFSGKADVDIGMRQTSSEDSYASALRLFGPRKPGHSPLLHPMKDTERRFWFISATPVVES